MTRQFPPEIHVGQRVLVYPNATTFPFEATVAHLDITAGLIHVTPLGSKQKWAARPRAVSSMEGYYLHFEDKHFFFDSEPTLN